MTDAFSLVRLVESRAAGTQYSGAGASGPSPVHMRAVLESYIRNLNDFDPTFFATAFAENYTYQDPVGAGTLAPHEMSARFHSDFFSIRGAELSSPISTSFGRSAAMAFRVFATVEGRDVTLDIVDVVTFDDSGKIVDVQAFWGADNITVGAETTAGAP